MADTPEKGIAKTALSMMAAPWACYAEAWCPGSTKGAATNPLEAMLGGVRDMTDQGMQDQLDAALKKFPV